jgi:hypothetical protein
MLLERVLLDELGAALERDTVDLDEEVLLLLTLRLGLDDGLDEGADLDA